MACPFDGTGTKLAWGFGETTQILYWPRAGAELKAPVSLGDSVLWVQWDRDPHLWPWLSFSPICKVCPLFSFSSLSLSLHSPFLGYCSLHCLLLLGQMSRAFLEWILYLSFFHLLCSHFQLYLWSSFKSWTNEPLSGIKILPYHLLTCNLVQMA